MLGSCRDQFRVFHQYAIVTAAGEGRGARARSQRVAETPGREPSETVALLNVGNGVGFYAAFVYAVTYIRDIH